MKTKTRKSTEKLHLSTWVNTEQARLLGYPYYAFLIMLREFSHGRVPKVRSKEGHHVKGIWKKYTSGPRYWNVPVLVNTGTFLVYQYCLKMWYLHSLERAWVIQKLTILERKNGLVLANTRVPVSGTWSIPFPGTFSCTCRSQKKLIRLLILRVTYSMILYDTTKFRTTS